MIQLKILTGKMAGTTWVARHFPVHLGRSADADLQLEEPGVWDQHLQINLGQSGFILETQSHALTSVNGHPTSQAALRNGDVIEIGSLKMQFWLGEAVQHGLKIRENLIWGIIAAVTLG